MKKLFLILLIAANTATAQNGEEYTNVVAAINVGYTKSVIGALQFGVRLHKVYLSVSNVVPLTQKDDVPVIAVLSAGYNIGSIQPFISYAYHTIGREAEARYMGTSSKVINCFHLGGGMSYYFKDFPLSFTAQLQGKQYIFSAGMYVIF